MKKKENSLSNYILSVIWPYKTWIFMLVLTGLSWALFNTFIPYALKLIIDHVDIAQDNEAQLLKNIRPYCLTYIALWIGVCVSMRLSDWAKMKFFSSLRASVIIEMFNYLSLHSYQYFQNHYSGSLINKINELHKGVANILSTIEDIYVQLIGIIIAIISMLFVHPIFSVILSGWIVLFLSTSIFFLKPIQKLSHALSDSLTTLIGKKVDSIGNIINVKLFARHKEESYYIRESIRDTTTKDRLLQANMIKMRLFWDVSILVLVGFNIYILLYMYSEARITIGDFTFVITLSISILRNLWLITGRFVNFSEQIANCKHALSILGKSHDIVDIQNAKPLIITSGKIEFKNVTFNYNGDTYLFKNKSTVIFPEQKIGLVGLSGSGKSTFVNLILRLFDVESGTIEIDGQNIKDVTQQSLREHIALIPQNITLFHRTIMENIRFGNIHANDEEVIAISKKAHCHEFINQLKDGYQSMVGEHGLKLSGGQRQRIAIARAMLKNAPILILDEATSALDSITEAHIQEALYEMMQNKTTIVITHRLSTLSKMDRILVFDNGKIIEDNSHEALMRLGGHYKKMWQKQERGLLPNQKI
ncbi:ABC transporter ATP-binding protein [Legionella pneumophila serogroup 1]